MKIPVIYASMSGNSEFLAREVAALLVERGVIASAEARHADSVDFIALTQLATAVFVLPTWGAGEVPADAEPLFDAIGAADAAALAGLSFGVIALGDRRYPDFCGGGKLFSARLREKGAQELVDPLLLDGIPMEKHLADVRGWLLTFETKASETAPT